MNLRVERFKIGGKGEVKYCLIYLPRKKPHKLEVCEVLLRRATLNDDERQRIEDLLLKGSIGYEGECYADRYWEDLSLMFPYALLHSLEVTHQNMFHHQMDTVFVCPKFLLIVELKYIAGELYYDEKANQFWRTYNGQRMALGDPFAQVSRHEMWMTHFLWDIGVDIPIINAVIVTAKSALLGRMPERFNMFKIEGLRLKLNEWLAHYPEAVTNDQIEFIASELLKRHKHRKWDWRKSFIDVKIKQGITCRCENLMQYNRGVFRCNCGNFDKTAHLLALHDYRVLINEWISNCQFRKLVGIESPHAANKILKRLNLEERGNTKLREYRIPNDIYK